VKGDLLEEIHGPAEGIEAEPGGEIVHIQTNVHPLLKIGGADSHTESKVLLRVAPASRMWNPPMLVMFTLGTCFTKNTRLSRNMRMAWRGGKM